MRNIVKHSSFNNGIFVDIKDILKTINNQFNRYGYARIRLSSVWNLFTDEKKCQFGISSTYKVIIQRTEYARGEVITFSDNDKYLPRVNGKLLSKDEAEDYSACSPGSVKVLILSILLSGVKKLARLLCDI